MINKGPLEIYATYAWQQNTIDVFIAANDPKGGLWLADPLVFREVELHASRSDVPTLRMTREEAQSLIDQMWRCGARPIEAAGSIGQLAAVGEHLKDMRQIAFDLLKRQGSPP